MKRREFLQKSSAGLFFFGQFGQMLKPPSKVTIGVITYSFRSMPGDIDDLIAYCQKCGISAIELMGEPAEKFAGAPTNPIDFSKLFVNGKRRELTEEEKKQAEEYRQNLAGWRSSVNMDIYKALKKKLKQNGIEVYAFKPSTFGVNNSDAEIAYGMKAAKALGAKSVTVELPRESAQIERLGRLGSEHKMYIGYHAHLQATDTLWDEALAQSPYNSLNLDCGHYIAAGGNNTKESLLKLIEDKHDRITSMHLKDRSTKENGAGNLEWGKGNTPICEIIRLVRDKNYQIPISIELEYQIPDGSNAVNEVKKCVEYAKACL